MKKIQAVSDLLDVLLIYSIHPRDVYKYSILQSTRNIYRKLNANVKLLGVFSLPEWHRGPKSRQHLIKK